MIDVDFELVEAAVRKAALDHALPRFRNLAAADISEKAPGDLLTVADLETERALTPVLEALLPDSIVVGEEAVAERPELLDALADRQPCWLVDPIDGTINFASGTPLFATMVALVVDGVIQAGWIYDSVHDVMASGVRGRGVRLAGQPVRLQPPPMVGRHAGCLHLSGYDRDLAATAARNFDAVGPLLVLHCAGLEYQAMLSNRLQYSLYNHTNPWDHAAGHLLLEEAGGFAARLDGTPYDVTTVRHEWPLLCAVNEASWWDLRRTLFGLEEELDT